MPPPPKASTIYSGVVQLFGRTAALEDRRGPPARVADPEPRRQGHDLRLPRRGATPPGRARRLHGRRGQGRAVKGTRPCPPTTTADHSSNASCASIPDYSPTTPLCAAAVRASCCVIKTHIYHRRDDTPDPRDRAVSKKQTLTQARGAIVAPRAPGRRRHAAAAPHPHIASRRLLWARCPSRPSSSGRGARRRRRPSA